MSLYPSIPYGAGLKALREVLEKREKHTIPTSELIKLQILFRRITTSSLTDKSSNKFLVPLLVPSLPPPYVCLLWIKLKLCFLKPKRYSLWCGLDILTIFFYLDTWCARTSITSIFLA